jgi:hypothetical protein
VVAWQEGEEKKKKKKKKKRKKERIPIRNVWNTITVLVDGKIASITKDNEIPWLTFSLLTYLAGRVIVDDL